jgi:uncharacterized membrane protein (UPF0127 family)
MQKTLYSDEEGKRKSLLDTMTSKTILALLLLCTLAFGCINTQKNETRYGTVCAKKTCFNVELAVTPEETERGLMYRETLASDAGMLFILPEESTNYFFWMKNTLIPLDIIWLDGNHRVISINRNMQPCHQAECPTVNPGMPARYVLEVNAGTADAINLTAGDAMEFQLPKQV